MEASTLALSVSGLIFIIVLYLWYIEHFINYYAAERFIKKHGLMEEYEHFLATDKDED